MYVLYITIYTCSEEYKNYFGGGQGKEMRIIKRTLLGTNLYIYIYIYTGSEEYKNYFGGGQDK